MGWFTDCAALPDPGHARDSSHPGFALVGHQHQIGASQAVTPSSPVGPCYGGKAKITTSRISPKMIS